MGYNRTGPPWSVSHQTADALGGWRTNHPRARQPASPPLATLQTPTDDNNTNRRRRHTPKQNNTGPLGGPVINIKSQKYSEMQTAAMHEPVNGLKCLFSANYTKCTYCSICWCQVRKLIRTTCQSTHQWKVHCKLTVKTIKLTQLRLKWKLF